MVRDMSHPGISAWLLSQAVSRSAIPAAFGIPQSPVGCCIVRWLCASADPVTPTCEGGDAPLTVAKAAVRVTLRVDGRGRPGLFVRIRAEYAIERHDHRIAVTAYRKAIEVPCRMPGRVGAIRRVLRIVLGPIAAGEQKMLLVRNAGDVCEPSNVIGATAARSDSGRS